jgi:Rha family phage regulatory protein
MIEKVKEVIKLQVVDGIVTTTSKDVAEMFGKEHKHVMESIKKLVEKLDFNQPNFRPVEYRDLKGEKRPIDRKSVV